MKIINHNTKKYDGSIHYRFKAEEIFRTDSVLVIYKEPEAPIHSYRGEYKNGRNNLGIMFTDRYFNMIIMWEGDWTPRMIYANIATPAVWDHREVSAVDLDIDVFRRCGHDEIVIDDKDEFEIHSKKYSYPQDLVDRCIKETEYVRSLFKKGEGIFSEEIFKWRPGKPLPVDIEKI